MSARPRHAGVGWPVLALGTTLAAGVFLTALKGVVVFHGLRDLDGSVAAAYGVVLTAQVLVVAVAGGLTVRALGTPSGRGDAPRHWDDGCELIQTSHLLAIGIAVAGGGVVAVLAPHHHLIAVAIAARLPGFVLLPAISVTSAHLVATGRHARLLRRSVENAAIVVAASIALPFVGLTSTLAVVAIGLFLSAVDVHTLVRQASADRGWAAQWARLAGEAVTGMRGRLGAAARRVPEHVAGGVDVIVLAGAFAVITLVAVAESPQLGVAVAALLALVRLVVLPIKSYGLAAGRVLAPLPPDAARTATTRIVGWSYACLLPVVAVCVAAPDVVAAAVGLPPHPALRLAIVLLGLELLLEPVTALAATALKVTLRPAANLGGLTVSLWAVAVPSVFVLAATDTMTLPRIWVALLAARLVFAAFVLRELHGLARPRRTPEPVIVVSPTGSATAQRHRRRPRVHRSIGSRLPVDLGVGRGV